MVAGVVVRLVPLDLLPAPPLPGSDVALGQGLHRHRVEPVRLGDDLGRPQRPPQRRRVEEVDRPDGQKVAGRPGLPDPDRVQVRVGPATLELGRLLQVGRGGGVADEVERVVRIGYSAPASRVR